MESLTNLQTWCNPSKTLLALILYYYFVWMRQVFLGFLLLLLGLLLRSYLRAASILKVEDDDDEDESEDKLGLRARFRKAKNVRETSYFVVFTLSLSLSLSLSLFPFGSAVMHIVTVQGIQNSKTCL